jgi:hypothetical protein
VTSLSRQSLKLDVGVIDKDHRVRNRPVSGRVRDEPMHCLTYSPVRRVALRSSSKLDHVHRFPSIQLHEATDPIRHWYGIWSDGGQLLGDECVV